MSACANSPALRWPSPAAAAAAIAAASAAATSSSALGIAAEMLEVSSGDGGDTVHAGDVFLLCTDGLWEYIEDSQLERTLAASATPREWLDALAVSVKHAAAHKTSHDNFTALVVWAGNA